MIDTGRLLKLAQIACDAAVSSGAEFADVSAGWNKNLSVDLESGAIKACEANIGGGLSVRAIYKGGTGWSSSDKLSEDSAAEAGKQAAALAKLAEPDPDFISLPEPAPDYPRVEGLSDPRVAELGIEQIISYALRNVDDALAVSSEAIIGGGFSASYGTNALANSLGVALTREGSYIGGHIMAVIKHGDDVGSFYDFDAARILDDFDPEGIGAEATRQALKFLGARKVETKRMPIVLGPLASRSVFQGVVRGADAEDVQRGRSFLIGKLGEKIASGILTITDDPLIPRGLSSRENDYEGVPSRPLVVLENGVLKSYLHSSYTAGKAGVRSTGHGTRGGGTAPSNIVPRLGDMTGEDIIRSTEEGIYINMGGVDPNGITGDVSSAIDFGFKIEDGELAYPVSSAMVGGKFLDMLANIDAISSDYREEPGMIMPTLRIQDVLVAGGK